MPSLFGCQHSFKRSHIFFCVPQSHLGLKWQGGEYIWHNFHFGWTIPLRYLKGLNKVCLGKKKCSNAFQEMMHLYQPNKGTASDFISGNRWCLSGETFFQWNSRCAVTMTSSLYEALWIYVFYIIYFKINPGSLFKTESLGGPSFNAGSDNTCIFPNVHRSCLVIWKCGRVIQNETASVTDVI